MQIAIASTDGSNVNEHFGRADRFLIYEIEGDSRLLLDSRTVTPLSEGDKGHAFNPERFSDITYNLAGCQRLYCTKIGGKPAAELKKLGIEPVVYNGPIENIKAV